MPKLIPTLLLVHTLALTTLGEAGPRQRPAPPVTHLTETERVCQTYGETAELLAQGRDKGMPYLTLVARLREQNQIAGLDPTMTQETINIARVIYDSPAITVVAARQQTEMQCLRRYAAQDATRMPPTAQGRY